MNATTTLLSPDFFKGLMGAADEAKKTVYQIYWDIFISFLAKYWAIVLIALVVILVVAVMRYAITGRWRMLGSVLYHDLYFGILFIVGSIFGSDIFVSSWFSMACTLILYPFCYWTVRVFLVKTGIKKTSFSYRNY